jgi:hypothetical protein
MVLDEVLLKYRADDSEAAAADTRQTARVARAVAGDKQLVDSKKTLSRETELYDSASSALERTLLTVARAHDTANVKTMEGAMKYSIARGELGQLTAAQEANLLSTTRQIDAIQRATAAHQKLKAIYERYPEVMKRAGEYLTVGLTLPIEELARHSLEASAKFDTMNNSLIRVMGGAAAANAELAKLRETAKGPGVNFDSVLQSSVKLQQAGFSPDDARKTISVLGNELKSVGKDGAESMAGVVNQLIQIESHAKVSSRGLIGLEEQLPEVGKALEAAFGTADPQKLEKMGISSKQLVAALITEWQKLGKMPDDLANKAKNATDAFQELMNSVGKALQPLADEWLPRITHGLEEVTKFIDDLPDPAKKAGAELMIIGAAAGPILYLGGVFASSATKILEFRKAMIEAKEAAQALAAADGVAGAATVVKDLGAASSTSAVEIDALALAEKNATVSSIGLVGLLKKIGEWFLTGEGLGDIGLGAGATAIGGASLAVSPLAATFGLSSQVPANAYPGEKAIGQNTYGPSNGATYDPDALRKMGFNIAPQPAFMGPSSTLPTGGFSNQGFNPFAPKQGPLAPTPEMQGPNLPTGADAAYYDALAKAKADLAAKLDPRNAGAASLSGIYSYEEFKALPAEKRKPFLNIYDQENPAAAGSFTEKAIRELAKGIDTPAGQASCAFFASELLGKMGKEIPKIGGAGALVDYVKSHGGKPEAPNMAKAGDLIYWHGKGYGEQKDAKGEGYHVGVSLGDGRVIDSSGGVTKTRKVFDLQHAGALSTSVSPQTEQEKKLADEYARGQDVFMGYNAQTRQLKIVQDQLGASTKDVTYAQEKARLEFRLTGGDLNELNEAEKKKIRMSFETASATQKDTDAIIAHNNAMRQFTLEAMKAAKASPQDILAYGEYGGKSYKDLSKAQQDRIDIEVVAQKQAEASAVATQKEADANANLATAFDAALGKSHDLSDGLSQILGRSESNVDATKKLTDELLRQAEATKLTFFGWLQLHAAIGQALDSAQALDNHIARQDQSSKDKDLMSGFLKPDSLMTGADKNAQASFDRFQQILDDLGGDMDAAFAVFAAERKAQESFLLKDISDQTDLENLRHKDPRAYYLKNAEKNGATPDGANAQMELDNLRALNDALYQQEDALKQATLGWKDYEKWKLHTTTTYSDKDIDKIIGGEEKVKKAQEMAKVAGEVKTAWEDAWMSFVDGSKSAGASLKDFIKQIDQMMLKKAAMAFADQTFNGLFGGLFGGGKQKEGQQETSSPDGGGGGFWGNVGGIISGAMSNSSAMSDSGGIIPIGPNPGGAGSHAITLPAGVFYPGGHAGPGGSRPDALGALSSILPLIFQGGRASGGPVGNGAYLVGERGPEILLNSGAKFIVPNHELGGHGGSGKTVNITVKQTFYAKDVATAKYQRANASAHASAARKALGKSSGLA